MKIPTHTFKKLALASVIAGASFAANADIVTSVKPLGFIASSIADGVLNTDVIVPAGASPHDYSLKPTDVQKVKNADVFLWIGEDVDSFLEKTADSLDKNKVIEISHFDEIKPLLGTSSHHHHHHDHDEADEHHHDHDHAKHEDEHEHEHELETNWHIWYSPAISKVVAQKVADKLTSLYPAQKEKIAQNLAQFNQSLDQQGEQIKAELAGVQGKGFYVFHDAYGYFNDAYGLKQTGAFTINPLVAPGAKTLAKIKEEILEHKVNCLFAEPQFTPKVIESLQKNTNVNVGQLDPLGEKVALGKDSYARFLQATADSYKACLAK